MVKSSHEVPGIVSEHHALMVEYGRAQVRCSQLLTSQAGQITRLEAQLVQLEDQLMQLRIAVLLRDTAHEWDSARRARHLGSYPAGRRKDEAQSQGNAHAAWQDADLVICQTGCVSQGNYWRDHDYCSRTASQCVLVGNDHALDGVRSSVKQKQ